LFSNLTTNINIIIMALIIYPNFMEITNPMRSDDFYDMFKKRTTNIINTIMAKQSFEL